MRAKFVVNSINRTLGNMPERDADGKATGKYVPTEMWSLTMSPVYGNGDPNHENTKFWQATPSGQIQLSTVNKAAVDTLTLGGEVYVDFTPVA